MAPADSTRAGQHLASVSGEANADAPLPGVRDDHDDNADATRAVARQISILLVGDTGFGGARQPVSETSGVRHGRQTTFERMTRDIEALVDTDFAFANLETVITRRNRLSPVGKAFNFRSHPNGVRHLVSLGFNLFSLANNHSMDYGHSGLADSVAEMGALQDAYDIGFAGLGPTVAAAVAPSTVSVSGTTVALSAVGIGTSYGSTFRPDGTRVGQPAYGDTSVRLAAEALAAAKADLRILSVHAGLERRVRPLDGDVKRMRDIAARENGVDLVVGHHAHVAQGVQIVDGRVVFYGLGNFMHPGMQDMAKFDSCRDYGLVARVHMRLVEGQRPAVGAVEAIPVTGMHDRPRAMSKAATRRRIAALNGLARSLDSAEHGARGIRFTVQPNGTGLYCGPAGALLEGALGERCRTIASQRRKGRTVRTPASACGAARVAGRGGSRASRASYRRRARRGGAAGAGSAKRTRSLADRLFQTN